MGNNKNLIVAVVLLAVVAVVVWMTIGKSATGGGSYEKIDMEKIPPPVEGKSLPVPPMPTTGGAPGGNKN